MLYVLGIAISLFLYVLNVSFLPHLWPQVASVTIVLPFLSLYSLRDKTVFPYILAVLAGLLYDGVTTLSLPFFAITFLLLTLIGKNLFSKITSYGLERSGFIMTIIGFFAITMFSWDAILKSYQNINLYLLLGFNLLVLCIIQFAVFRLLAPYFDWVEKTTAERFR